MKQSSAAPHSPRAHAARHWQYLGPHTATTPLQVTVVLRRRAGAKPQVAAWPHHAPVPRAQFGQHCGADPADLERLRAFARQHGLRETGADPKRRVLQLSGTPQALEGACGVKLGSYRRADGSGPFSGYEPPATLPPEALAVLGLDRRPVARSHVR